MLNNRESEDFEGFDSEQISSNPSNGFETVDETYRDYDVNLERDAELAKVLIETDSYINRIQLTLENKYLKKVKVKKEGKWEYSQVPTQVEGTIPLANEYGISQIVGRVKGIIHHAMALGNIDKNQYGLFLHRFIKDFVRSLIGHRIEWGIRPNNLRDIRRIVVDGVQLFITRPIGNIERRGLVKYSDPEPAQEKGFLDGFGDKMKKKNKGGYYG